MPKTVKSKAPAKNSPVVITQDHMLEVLDQWQKERRPPGGMTVKDLMEELWDLAGPPPEPEPSHAAMSALVERMLMDQLHDPNVPHSDKKQLTQNLKRLWKQAPNRSVWSAYSDWGDVPGDNQDQQKFLLPKIKELVLNALDHFKANPQPTSSSWWNVRWSLVRMLLSKELDVSEVFFEKTLECWAEATPKTASIMGQSMLEVMEGADRTFKNWDSVPLKLTKTSNKHAAMNMAQWLHSLKKETCTNHSWCTFIWDVLRTATRKSKHPQDVLPLRQALLDCSTKHRVVVKNHLESNSFNATFWFWSESHLWPASLVAGMIEAEHHAEHKKDPQDFLSRLQEGVMGLINRDDNMAMLKEWVDNPQWCPSISWSEVLVNVACHITPSKAPKVMSLLNDSEKMIVFQKMLAGLDIPTNLANIVRAISNPQDKNTLVQHFQDHVRRECPPLGALVDRQNLLNAVGVEASSSAKPSRRKPSKM